MKDYRDLMGEPEEPKKKRKQPPRVSRKKKPASLSNLTKEVGARIISCVKLGSDLEMACNFAGVTKYELEYWLERANKALDDSEGKEDKIKEEDQKYVVFLKRLRKAVAQAQMIDLRRIDAAAESGKWQASAWKLVYGPLTKERWFKTSRQQITGEDGGPIQHELTHTSVDMDRLLAALPLETRIKVVEALMQIKNSPEGERDENVKKLIGEVIDHDEIKLGRKSDDNVGDVEEDEEGEE